MRTELPEKWCIKNNSKIKDIIGYWFKTNLGRIPTDNFDNSYWHYPQTTKNTSSSYNIFENYVEITFEEFKTLVLGEKQQPTEPQYEIY